MTASDNVARYPLPALPSSTDAPRTKHLLNRHSGTLGTLAP
jgi:hypothetical protein